MKLSLQQAQEKFEKVNRKEQIPELVNEITRLQNLEWYERDLESIVITGKYDFVGYLTKNITNLLQGLQQFKSNLQTFKMAITTYSETEIQERGSNKEENQQILTETTTLEHEAERSTVHNSKWLTIRV